jgi:hypothetical protein
MPTHDQEDQPLPRLAIAAKNRGQRVVLAMLLVAVVAATFAWCWNFQRGQRALELYGAEGAALVRMGPKVEYLRSAPDENIDISHAPGLLNARTSLLSDASYEWAKTDTRLDSPLFSVRFSDGQRAIVVTFDFENRTIQTSSTGRTATLAKKTANGWQAYLARQLKNNDWPAKRPSGVNALGRN